MDTTRIKGALDSARKAVANVKAEISATTSAAIKAGEKDPLQFNGLQALGSANLKLDKAGDVLDAVQEQVDKAVEKTTAKVKEKKEKKDKDAKK